MNIVRTQLKGFFSIIVALAIYPTPHVNILTIPTVYCYGESDLIDFLNDIPGKHRSVYDVISVEIWHLVINEDTKGCEHLRLFTAISLRDVK